MSASKVSKLLFSGKTAVITGAGGALGRAYALELARRGCAVVCNDIGGSLEGVDPDTARLSPAQAIADEITAGGGMAWANTDSVLEGDKIVQVRALPSL